MAAALERASRKLLGAALVAAVCLKAWDVLSGLPLPVSGWLAAGLEFAMGLALFVCPGAVWPPIGVAAFFTVAGAHHSLVILRTSPGPAACGCLGSVLDISHWHALALSGGLVFLAGFSILVLAVTGQGEREARHV